MIRMQGEVIRDEAHLSDAVVKSTIIDLEDHFWYGNATKRILWLYGSISEERMQRLLFCAQLLALESKEPIKLLINSPGGTVTDALAFYDLLIHLRCNGIPVYTIGVGEVSSAATIVFQAGEKRLLLPSTLMLLHEISAWFAGKSSEQEDTMKMIQKLERRVYEILGQRSGKKPSAIKKMIKRRDLWLTAQEACKLHFADEVVESVEF